MFRLENVENLQSSVKERPQNMKGRFVKIFIVKKQTMEGVDKRSENSV